ncbi:MAG: hypothetical protein UX49_C0050G0003 [Candidatus Wolfebacteria bacterium GW2011_GWC2_46_275]|nr:MAG: hypothetical protein UX49_C0050G0003 [Candidatus Wolfebacteria bacterium GW2011_GWC2_46_275]KKU42030.1 MAG: hypothetical protein UX58_C0004G0089 [Candidatus Wolfebacteria bacterium GW2011_GWB2_46_69]KKU54433.1 MAG: hypothetical protein UX76_C0002G0026 [Candidatus Wolfebacteria bacterium GW2011_GWC1_47_103]KKU59761.1 MAG: hypothetical protein UX83_C0002G0048 [Candidatus Wolfebacteria bacterium GW2011_GWE2_47_12]
MLKWGLIGLLVMIAIARVTSAVKKENGVAAVPAETAKSDRDYAASYNFSKVDGKVVSQTFTVPAGGKWVYVALPAYYTATFSSATAKTGELDKLDGSKPLQFGKHTKFGDLPMAVAIRVPEGCKMTVSMVYNPTLGGNPPTEKVSSKKERRIMRKDLPKREEDIPKTVQII